MTLTRRLMIAAALAALFLSGCTTVRSDVTRYHQLAKGSDGTYGTYSIFVPKDQQDSLEYARYAGLFKQQLNANGFREVPLSAGPTYVAFFAFATGLSGSSTTSIYAPQASGNSAFARGFNSSAGAVATTEASYARSLRFSLLKGGVEQTPGQRTVFEGRLMSVGSTADINRVMPVLVKAMFVDFPGMDGETRRIDLPLQ